MGNECIGKVKAYVIDTVTLPIPYVIGHHEQRQLSCKGLSVNNCRTVEQAQSASIDLLVGVDALVGLLTHNQIPLSSHMCAVES